MPSPSSPSSSRPSASASASAPAPSSSDVPTITRRPLLWWGLVLAALVIGYGDLWRGGITIGPIMLVLAYCVLVPLAILRG